MIVKCHCCDGTGQIEDEPPVTLTPMQARIYTLIARFKLGGPALVGKLYEADPNGGPDFPMEAIHVQIHNMNKRLAKVGKKVEASSRGPGATYRIINVV